MIYSYLICSLCGGKAVKKIYTDEQEFSLFDIQDKYICPNCEATFKVEINLKYE